MINQSIEQIQSAIDTCIYICISKMGMGKNRNIKALATEFLNGDINVLLRYDSGRVGSIHYFTNPNEFKDDTKIVVDKKEFIISSFDNNIEDIINKCWEAMEDIGLLPDMEAPYTYK